MDSLYWLIVFFRLIFAKTALIRAEEAAEKRCSAVFFCTKVTIHSPGDLCRLCRL